MNQNNRVFITGLGALTASGESAQETWDALCRGESGLGEITQHDLSTWTHRLGGELKNYQPAKMLPDRKLMKVISKQDVLGINAAMQAVNHSGMMAYKESLENSSDFDEQTAVFVGSPGNKYYQQYDFLPLIEKTKGNMQEFAGQLFNEVHPMWLLRILPNNVLAYTGITYGFKGPNHNVTNHAVGGTQAIIEAYHAIRTGQAHRAVVVAYDIGTEPQALYYYEKLGVLSSQHLKPFDVDHDGTVLAEGAAALVLESEASVLERQAKCYAEIAAGASATEGMGLFSLAADGAPLMALMNNTLAASGVSASEIDLIVAHGNGNMKSDDSEALAINTVFSKNSAPVTAFKWAMGHTLSASGVLDTVLSTLALNNHQVPGIANLTSVAESCAGLNISSQNRALSQNRNVMIINRGYASMNACLVIKSCE